MDDIVIVSAARTPVGSFSGALGTLSAHELGTVALRAAFERAGVEAGDVDEVTAVVDMFRPNLWRRNIDSMSRRAWTYIGAVLVIGITFAGLSLATLTPAATLWLPFTVLLTGAMLAQLFKAEGPNHELFYASAVFLFAAILLLPGSLFVPLVIIPHVVEWIRERRVGAHFCAPGISSPSTWPCISSRGWSRMACIRRCKAMCVRRNPQAPWWSSLSPR